MERTILDKMRESKRMEKYARCFLLPTLTLRVLGEPLSKIIQLLLHLLKLDLASRYVAFVKCSSILSLLLRDPDTFLLKMKVFLRDSEVVLKSLELELVVRGPWGKGGERFSRKCSK
jgi:hypothetical protein